MDRITPEFNYGIPGSLKNLIGWASRPAFNSPRKSRPSMVIALSPAPTGGARAHVRLVSVLSSTLTPAFAALSLIVGAMREKIGEDGQLIDEQTKVRLQQNLEAFSGWAEKNPA